MRGSLGRAVAEGDDGDDPARGAEMLEFFSKYSMSMILIGIVLIGLIIIGIAINFSVAIMMKKEY